jgi:hypothetical protein
MRATVMRANRTKSRIGRRIEPADALDAVPCLRCCKCSGEGLRQHRPGAHRGQFWALGRLHGAQLPGKEKRYMCVCDVYVSGLYM